MVNPHRLQRPLWGIGITSFVLGTVGLVLFGLPILGAPISAVGLVCGLVGCGAARLVHTSTLRWSVAGIALCGFALSLDLTMQYSPRAALFLRQPPEAMRNIPTQPFVSPPSHWVDY